MFLSEFLFVFVFHGTIVKLTKQNSQIDQLTTSFHCNLACITLVQSWNTKSFLHNRQRYLKIIDWCLR